MFEVPDPSPTVSRVEYQTPGVDTPSIVTCESTFEGYVVRSYIRNPVKHGGGGVLHPGH